MVLGFSRSTDCVKIPTNIYDIEVVDLQTSETIKLDIFRKKVLLITNVASSCGLTNRHINFFNDLKEEIDSNFFEILAFPSNDFFQERLVNNKEELCDFYYNKKKSLFKLYSPVSVNGENAHPLFNYMKYKLPDDFVSKRDGNNLFRSITNSLTNIFSKKKSQGKFQDSSMDDEIDNNDTSKMIDNSSHKETTIELSQIGWNFGKFIIDSKGVVQKYFSPNANLDEVRNFILSILPR